MVRRRGHTELVDGGDALQLRLTRGAADAG
jgi:hypothetical protein